jgi:DNA-binding transcriptional ArsR family regulator
MAVTAVDGSPSVLGDESAELVARRLSSLAEPTRIKLVLELRARGSAAVHELAEAVGSSLPNVSKHLQVLYQAGIVARRREGTYVRYRIAGDAVGALAAYAVRILDTARR